MTDEEILARIETVVRDVVGDDSIKLTMNTVAQEVDGWDSMAHINIISISSWRWSMSSRSSSKPLRWKKRRIPAIW